MSRRRAALASLLAIFALAGADAPAVERASALAPAAAINKAGRQRMLSQRTAKAYLMIGQNIQPGRGRAILAESRAQFEGELAELKGYAPSEDVRQALARLERDWRAFERVLVAPPNATNARELYDLNEAVQEAAHRLTLAYEKAAGRPEDRLVNVAGRQRMLSQRIAKYWLFRNGGVNAAAAEMELNMARAEFSSGMTRLYVAGGDDPEIRAELGQLDRDWAAYHAALTRGEGAARGGPQIVDLSERVLVRCERLVTLFEKRARAGAR
jgi:nitrate/nitrite-specific signal transduction histidine kinase